MNVRRTLIAFTLLAGIGSMAHGQVILDGPPQQEKKEPVKTPVDLVFLIDCSVSMISHQNNVRQRMHSIIDMLVQESPDNDLRVGAIRYGDGLKRWSFLNLTNNARQVNNFLDATRPDFGGAEFVGAFVEKAHKEMAWSKDKNAKKIIVVIGNEGAMQGPEDSLYPKSARLAYNDGIVIHTIYAAMSEYELRKAPLSPTGTTLAVDGWKDLAKIGGGTFGVLQPDPPPGTLPPGYTNGTQPRITVGTGIKKK